MFFSALQALGFVALCRVGVVACSELWAKGLLPPFAVGVKLAAGIPHKVVHLSTTLRLIRYRVGA